MVWFVRPLERKDKRGFWHLTAESDEDGGFWVGCSHDHPSAQEAQECKEAKQKLGGITGFPARDDEDEAA